MSTSTTSLSVNQWRLLNVLYRFASHRGGRPAPRMLAIAEATVSDLMHLCDAELVEIRIGDTPIDIGRVNVRAMTGLNLALTGRGARLVTTDETNRALMAVADQPGQWMKLDAAIRASNTSVRTYIDLHREGLVEVILAGPAGVPIDTFRQPERIPAKEMKVRPTAAGRHRAGL